MRYDVFISYKREGGDIWAELVRAILVYKYHLNVFLDVDTLHGGEWSPQLRDAIKESSNVVIILFKDLGKKLKLENDVFIQEIKQAIDFNKPIIPFYAADCNPVNILKSKLIPDLIKNIVSKQHGIVKYLHENTEATYNLLKQQLEVKIELNICSQYDSCYMKYHINSDPPTPTIKIEENSNVSICLNRSFVGEIHVSFYTEKSPIIIEFLICVGNIKSSEKAPNNYNEIYYWQSDKEIQKSLHIDWKMIKKRILENSMTSQSFNPMQTVLGTMSQYVAL